MTGRVLPAVLGRPRSVRLSSGLLALFAAIGLSWLAAQRRWHADVALVPFLAAAVVFMGMVPGLVRRARRLAGRPRPMVPYLPLMGLAYAVYYGLPGLLLDQDSGITDNADAARSWIEQTQDLRGTMPFVVVSSAQSAPMIQPYYESRQVSGLISGLYGGSIFEQYNAGRPGTARRYWDAYSLGMLIAMSLVLGGGFWNLALGLRDRAAAREAK